MDATQQLQIVGENLNLTEEQQQILLQNLIKLRTATIIETDDAIAKAQDGSRLTRRGLDLLAKAVAGKELQYTRVAFGDSVRDGQVVEVSIEDGLELNDLIHWRIDLPMTDIKFTGGGTAAVTFAVQNVNIQEFIMARELGLFARDPDTGEEILYCYRNTAPLGDPIPAGNGAVLWDIRVTLITVVDNALNVTAIIDANLSYVSQTEFTAHVNSTNPHPNIPNLGNEVTATTMFWAIDEDRNLHPITAENAAKLILGGDAGDIPKMNSRLSQVEVNVANLYMQLKTENELGLTGNLILVEDFADCDCTDRYECNVLSSFAGSSQLNLESDRGILSGHWYTISDGINSEYVQVRSVARNGANYAAFLEEELIYTYNPDCTKLLRSTALIGVNKAQGAGDLRSVAYRFDEIFTGTGGNVSVVLTLDTTQNNANAFDLTGDAAFTTEGYFTLTA